MKSSALLAVAMLLAPARIFAQEAPLSCPATPAPLPPQYAGWATASALTAATTPAGLATARIRIGSRADIALVPTTQVQFAAPEKSSAPDSHAGMAGFTVPSAGTYRVVLGAGAWIDVVRDGKPVLSGVHGHGVACTAIHKNVDFALTPGDYLLQITGSREAAISVMILLLLP